METDEVGEELKQIRALVLILPMRNGNQIHHNNRRVLNKFLSYLWGMETKSW